MIERVVSEYMANRPHYAGRRTPAMFPRSAPTISVDHGMPSRSPRRSEKVEDRFIDLARALRADRLDADMVGAGVPMLLDAGADRGLVPPGDDRVNKAVGAAAGKVGLAKALAAPRIDVVLELQVVRQRLARGTARCRRDGFEQNPDFGCQD